VVYVHTEQTVELCHGCWESSETDHAQHARTEHRVVSGKLCAPPSLDAAAMLSALDAALQGQPGARVYAPELCLAAGAHERAQVEQRRFDMLQGG
jgi:hypothetical protein